MIRHFTLVLAATPKRLSDVYGDGAGVANPANDIPYRHVLLQVSGADAAVGESTVTTTDYGILLTAAAPAPVQSVGRGVAGPVKLSDFYAVGAGSTIHVLAVPF